MNSDKLYLNADLVFGKPQVSNAEKLFVVTVKFNQRGQWSKEYDYLSKESVQPNSIALVKDSFGFVTPVRVKRCNSIHLSELRNDVKYAYIFKDLNFKFEEIKQ